MTPGEVKGYLKQLLHRKEISREEKQAVQFALDTMEVTLAVAPIVSSVVKELKSVKNSNDGAVTNLSGEEADPNTGWKG